MTPTPKPPRLLIVVDDEGTRASLGHALSLEGYETKSAASAQEALALLRSESFAAVLSDVVMPGQDGLESWSGCARRRPTCRS